MPIGFSLRGENMQAYISRTFVNPESYYSSSSVGPFGENSVLPAICAFCGDEIWSETEPRDDALDRQTFLIAIFILFGL